MPGLTYPCCSDTGTVQVLSAQHRQIACSLKLTRLSSGDWFLVFHDISDYRKKELFSKVQMAWVRSKNQASAGSAPSST